MTEPYNAPPPPPMPVAPAKPDRTNLYGILGIVIGFICCPIIGIVLGILSIREAKAHGKSSVLGIVAIVLSVVAAVVGGIYSVSRN
ncbi:MAG: DUF4190 domain-containing protein [Hamadaea sp.]|uniref:DUF4190 domain-containing protein n=1 Tax=Hamadaea sp. TaxID=2024425 RepID=UPI0017D1C4F4|nr:DUF4190 domain-containing protein [Hamadaea sp.]NUR72696.1 DUF4190 domain-containing protein [Hamadaea sp.]NUT23458.1 DUF4190 domain-containing protein [Hamadaea sp.]